MTLLATITTELVHTVRLVHASTGAPIRAVRVGPALGSPGWSTRVVDGTAVVTRRTDGSGPAPTHLDLIITDATLAAVLDLPAAADDQPPSSVRVALTGPTLEVPLAPVPMVLTVVLAAHTTGAPSVGKTVTVRPSTGAAVTLDPVPGKPGHYASDARVWTAAFTPADLRIGSTTVRKVSLDFTRAQTSIHVVDPT